MRDFDWKIITTLYKTKNITKTADLLFVSQPSLTKRLQIIEEELGVTLVVRSRRGTEFTPAGEAVAIRADQIVNEIDALRQELHGTGSEDIGVLRIGVPYSYNRYVMPQLMAKYSAKHPGVEADIISGISDELIREVENGNMDACFAHYNAEDSYLERIYLGEDQMVAVNKTSFEIKDLPDMPCIEFNKNPATLSATKRWWNERFDVPIRVRYKVNNGDVCVNMIENGLGYGIFSDPKYFQKKDGLYTLPLEFLDGTKFLRRTWLFYGREALKRPAVAGFIKLVSNVDVNHL